MNYCERYFTAFEKLNFASNKHFNFHWVFWLRSSVQLASLKYLKP
jgi:hypothetical protein